MAAAEKVNQHELDARALKIAALTPVIDQHLTKIDVHPWSAMAAPVIAALPDETWLELADLAGCNPPSPLTRGQIVANYRARLTYLAAVRKQEGV